MTFKLTASIVGVLATLVVTTSVSAQGEIEPFDSNTGYDHVSQPPPGAFSSADWCFSFNDESLVGDTIEVTAVGPTGVVTGVGVVEASGTTLVRVGITEGGDYAVTSIRAVEAGVTISSANVDAIKVVFDPEFISCLDGLVVAPPPAPPAAATTPAPVTTAAPTTAAATAPPVTAVASDPEPTDSSSSLLWWILIGAGAALFLGGGLVFFSPKRSSTKERKRTKSGEKEDDDDPRDAPKPRD